jgi:hypothetical protein
MFNRAEGERERRVSAAVGRAMTWMDGNAMGR